MAIHCYRRGVWTEHTHTSFFYAQCTCSMMCNHTTWLKMSQGSKCLHERITPNSCHPWWAVERLFLVVSSFWLSPCVSPHFYLYSVLNFFFHVDNAKANVPCVSANWGVLLSGRIHPSHRLWAQAPWRFPQLGDYWNDLPGGIWRQGYGALVLVWRNTPAWALRVLIFPLHYYVFFDICKHVNEHRYVLWNITARPVFTYFTEYFWHFDNMTKILGKSVVYLKHIESVARCVDLGGSSIMFKFWRGALMWRRVSCEKDDRRESWWRLATMTEYARKPMENTLMIIFIGVVMGSRSPRAPMFFDISQHVKNTSVMNRRSFID